MSVKSIALVAALVLVGVAHPASAMPSQADPPFRFSFDRTELANPVASRALEARLRVEAATYCRRSASEGSSPVLSRGCQRSVFEAARAALVRARAGHG